MRVPPISPAARRRERPASGPHPDGFKDLLKFLRGGKFIGDLVARDGDLAHSQEAGAGEVSGVVVRALPRHMQDDNRNIREMTRQPFRGY